MIETSALYKSIVAGPHEFEWKVKINTATYYDTQIVRNANSDCAPRISRQTFPSGSPSIGNCLSSEFSVTLLEPSYNIPRIGSVKPYFRAVPASGEPSEWIQAGEFFIDMRRYDIETKTTTLTCYDAMLKAEGQGGNSYYDLTRIVTWPASASSVVSDIASIIGVSVDSRTALQSGFMVDDPGDLTMREVLGYIAAEHCGNWVITAEGMLRLIPLCGDDTDTIPLGLSADSMEVMPALREWTKVTLSKDREIYYTAGDDSGIAITAEDPWATQAKANYAITVVDGISYQPFSASNAFVDPAVELGDEITFTNGNNTLTSNVWSIDLICDEFSIPTVGAPGGDEYSHEYPYIPLVRRRVRRVEEEVEELEDSIEETVDTEVDQKLDLALVRAKKMDFNGWDSGSFYEILDNDVRVDYTVLFDAQDRPVMIVDGSHVCEIVW